MLFKTSYFIVFIDKFILTTSSLITEIPTVVELVTNPALRNTTATGTRELIAATALIH